MTADARCSICRTGVAWFDDRGWVHNTRPSEPHDATPDRDTLERTFVDTPEIR